MRTTLTCYLGLSVLIVRVTVGVKLKVALGSRDHPSDHKETHTLVIETGAEGTYIDDNNNIENVQFDFGNDHLVSLMAEEIHANTSAHVAGAHEVRINSGGSGRLQKIQHPEQALLMQDASLTTNSKGERRHSEVSLPESGRLSVGSSRSKSAPQKDQKDKPRRDVASGLRSKKAPLVGSSANHHFQYDILKAASSDRSMSKVSPRQRSGMEENPESHFLLLNMSNREALNASVVAASGKHEKRKCRDSIAQVHSSGRRARFNLAEDQSVIHSLMGWIFLGLIIVAAYWYAKHIKLFTRYRDMFPALGELLLRYGIDKHASFDLDVMVHEVILEEQTKNKTSTRVQLSAGDNKESTPIGSIGKSKRVSGASVTIFECVLKVEVPQGTSKIVLKLCDSRKDEPIAETKWDVDQVLGFIEQAMDEDTERTFDMKLVGKYRKLMAKDPKVIVSFGLDDDSQARIASGRPSMGQPTSGAKINLLDGIRVENLSKSLRSMLEKNAKKKVKEFDADMEFTFKEIAHMQLNIIADLAKGDLEATQGFWGKHALSRYALHWGTDVHGKQSLNTWKFSWWPDQEAQNKGLEPDGSILVLQICRIFPVNKYPDDFVIVYVVPGPHDVENSLQLSCVDFPRDVWVEALQAFIVHLRAIRHKVAEDKRESISAGKKSIGNVSKKLKKSVHADVGGTSDGAKEIQSPRSPKSPRETKRRDTHSHEDTQSESHAESDVGHKKSKSTHSHSKSTKSHRKHESDSDSDKASHTSKATEKQSTHKSKSTHHHSSSS